jgi:WD40 repeat protein
MDGVVPQHVPDTTIFQVQPETAAIDGVHHFAYKGKDYFVTWSKRSLTVLDLTGAVLSLEGHTSPVTSAKYLDLKGEPYIISLSADSCQLWSLKKEQFTELFKPRSRSSRILPLFIDEECRVIEWSPFNRTIKIWNVEKGESPAILDAHSKPVKGVDLFDFKGERRVLSWGEDGVLCVWSGKSYKLLHRFEEHTQAIRGARFYPMDGGCGSIVSWAEDGTVRMWEAEAREEWPAFQADPGVGDGQFFVLKKRLHFLTYASSTVLCVWSMPVESPISYLQGHQASINGAHCLTLGGESRLLTHSEDATLRLWNPEDGECLFIFKGHRGAIVGVKLVTLGSGLHAVSYSEDGTLRLWDLAGHALTRTWVGHSSGVIGAQLVTLDGESKIISWSRDRTIRVWKI